MCEPMRLTPSLREKVWGRKQLSPWFPDAAEPVGEAWFLAPHDLPLLVKLIFTSEPLSVQVHPEDGDYGSRGKTEMWHILAAEPGARIALGFCRPLAREEFRQAVEKGEIARLLNWIPVKAGETYFTPARTVHSIGAGIVLCEIQQNSDVTYRLWDYGRPRPIHVEQALPISDLTVHPGAVRPEKIGEDCERLVRCKYFVAERVHLRAGASLVPAPERCQLWICIAGAGTIGNQPVRSGEVWLLPETGKMPAIAGEADFLRTWAPG